MDTLPNMPQAGNLIKVTDPVWDWLNKGDVGVIIMVKEWKHGAPDSLKKPRVQYLYKVKFTNGQVRTINSREFCVIA